MRIDAWRERLQEFAVIDTTIKRPAKLGSLDLENFSHALDDDLNISAALAVLFEVIRESNRLLDTATMTPQEAAAILAWWHHVNSVLALEPEPPQEIPSEVLALLVARKTARDEQQWAESDRLRDEIAAMGWQIKDTKGEQKVTKK